MREPSFSWNPPICNTLTAVCEGDIDDQYDFDKIDIRIQHDNDDDSFDEANSQAGGVTKTPVKEVLQDDGDSHNVDIADHTRGTNPRLVATHHNFKGSAGVIPDVPTQHDNDDDSFDEANSQAGGVTKTPVEDVL